MANRYFRSQFVYSMEKDVKQIFADVQIGATGAPTLVAKNSKGVQAITRVSAGKYKVIFGVPAGGQAASTDLYYKLLMVKHVFINSTAPASPALFITQNNINVDGSITIEFNSSGTATDPASGEEVLLQFIFGDSNT